MYNALRYNSKSRWLSYWYQISETLGKNPKSILLIGKGSGIVENSISIIAPHIKIIVLDIYPELRPDVVGDIKHLPFKETAFDCIICCQVLEHIPFEFISGVLGEFRRIVKDYAVISVPHKRKHIKIDIDFPIVGHKILIVKNPFTKKNIRSKHHHWEINRGESFGDVKKKFEQFFTIEKTFLNEMNCAHRFFILRKDSIEK